MKLNPYGLKSVVDIRGITSAKIVVAQTSNKWPYIRQDILVKRRSLGDPFGILATHRNIQYADICNGSKQVII